MEMERGKAQMLPLKSTVACTNVEAAVAVSEAFGSHFVQLKSVMQKCYVALSSCFVINLRKQ